MTAFIALKNITRNPERLCPTKSGLIVSVDMAKVAKQSFHEHNNRNFLEKHVQTMSQIEKKENTTNTSVIYENFQNLSVIPSSPRQHFASLKINMYHTYTLSKYKFFFFKK